MFVQIDANMDFQQREFPLENAENVYVLFLNTSGYIKYSPETDLLR